MNIKDRLTDFLNETLVPEQFLVDMDVAKGSRTKVTAFVDSDSGMTIEECARISREVLQRIEEEDVFQGEYMLEVSSPGLDKPLKHPRQFVKNVGRRIRVDLLENRTHKGELKRVSPDSVIIVEETKKGKKTDRKEVEIAFNEIRSTKVLVSF